MMEDKIIIVGTGFAGSVLARKFAEAGRKVSIIEKRRHIAGNMYDYDDENGIRIQKYGPHTFHTNIDRVQAFITQYCSLDEYKLKCQAVIDGIATPSPFNFKTIDQFYDKDSGDKLKKRLAEYFNKDSATVLEMLNCDDTDIKAYAEFLFAKDYSLYTAKQWGKDPDEIDPSVLKRVPVIFNYRDTYFADKYEGMPKNGFTEVFRQLLNHPNITVELETDAMDHITVDGENRRILFDGEEVPVIFTGAIDELFGFKFGKLPYRSLYFEYKYFDKKDYQKVAIVAHPAAKEYTRITEYTKLPYQEAGNKTVIAVEYSVLYDKSNEKGNEPYYPVLTEESMNRYQLYKNYAEQFDNLVLCGRLADFKYYNMDLVIDRALSVYEDIKARFI